MAISGPHAILGYSAGGSYTLTLTALDTGLSRTFPGTAGRPSSKTAAVIGGKLYLGSGDPGWLLECDGNVVRTIGPCGDRDYYSGALSPDGRLFLGTYPKGALEIYNPAADTLTRVGEFDAAFTAPQYVYTLATDGRYAYAGMGQDPWYLAVLDTQTGQASQYFKEDNLPTTNVEQAADGSGIYFGNYQLIDGAPVLAQSRPAMRPWYLPCNVVIDKSGFADTGYDVVLDNANVATGITPEISWNPTGDADWQNATLTGVQTAPAVLKRAISVGNRILILSGFYGPLVWFTPATGAFEIVGWTNYSLYDALAVGTDVYLSGYTAVTFRWDTLSEWTLTPSAPDLTATNPRKVAAWHKYHYYQTLAVGIVWVGVNHERDSTGGELGWYDPVTDDTGSLRTEFENWTPRALTTVGAFVVYSGNARDGADGRVFVVNTATKTVTASYAPIAGTTDAGVIVGVSSADLVGVTGTAAYRMGIADGAIRWKLTLPAAAFGMAWYDRRIATAPDGWLWFAIGNAIYRLNPADGTLNKVTDTDAPYNVCFHGGDVYLYGGTQLLKVRPKA